ncbi:hypothetical protein ABZ746_35120 [Streptomyces sp. NPDC020096]
MGVQMGMMPRSTAIGCAIAAVAAVFSTPASAATTPQPNTTQTPSSTSGEFHADGGVLCSVHADNPHYSGGAKGVIYKSRVTCAGTVPAEEVRCQGQLIYSVGGEPPSTAATSDETRTVTTDGSTTTFYTPQYGGKNIQWSGNFQGYTTCTLVSPYTGTVGSSQTPVVYINA